MQTSSSIFCIALQQIKSRVHAPVGTRYANLILAGCAVGAVLLYWIGLVQPYHLFDHYDRPLLDLLRISKEDPAARWPMLWALLAVGALYWLGWRAAQRASGRLAWAIVLGGALASATTLLFLFPFGAADIFDNIMHGRLLGIYWHNPFYSVATNFPDDPFRPYMAWPGHPSAYGPLWELLAAGAAYLSGDGIIANVIVFKLIGGFFLAASTLVVIAILQRFAPERALAGALLLAWNPIILYETLGHGHNDIAIVFWILLAVWLLLSKRYTLTILALLVGALIKYIPLLMLPAAGLIVLRELPDWRSWLRFVVISGVLGIVLVLLAYSLFWRDLYVLSIGRRSQLFTSSIPALLHYNLLAPWLGKELSGVWISGVAAGLTALFAIWQGVVAWRDRSWLSFPRATFNILMFYLLLTCLWFQSWYALWPLGLAALLPPGHAARLAALFGYAVLSKQFIFEPMWLWIKPFPPLAWRELRLGPAVLALPWIYSLIAIWDSKRKERIFTTHDHR
jgi:alpha-1,6-mannosyltransferase